MAGTYYKGTWYKTWEDLATNLLKQGGVNPTQWLARHPFAAQKLGVMDQYNQALTFFPQQGGLSPKDSGTTSVTSPGAPPAPPGTLTPPGAPSGPITPPQGSSGAPGAPVGQSVIPGVGIYGMYQNQAEKAYEQAIASINQRQQDILTQYGFQGKLGPGGELTDVQEDPTSVYGVLPMLRRSHAEAYETEEERTAARNIGTGGLAQRGAEELAYQGGADYAKAFGGFREAIGETTRARQEAASQLSESNLFIQMQALQDAVASEQFTPADVSSLLTKTSTTSKQIKTPYPKKDFAKLIRKNRIMFQGKSITKRKQLIKFLNSQNIDLDIWKRKHPKLWRRFK